MFNKSFDSSISQFRFIVNQHISRIINCRVDYQSNDDGHCHAKQEYATALTSAILLSSRLDHWLQYHILLAMFVDLTSIHWYGVAARIVGCWRHHWLAIMDAWRCNLNTPRDLRHRSWSGLIA